MGIFVSKQDLDEYCGEETPNFSWTERIAHKIRKYCSRLNVAMNRVSYNIWRFRHRNDIRRYGEFTVRRAGEKGISPFEELYDEDFYDEEL